MFVEANREEVLQVPGVVVSPRPRVDRSGEQPLDEAPGITMLISQMAEAVSG